MLNKDAKFLIFENSFLAKFAIHFSERSLKDEGVIVVPSPRIELTIAFACKFLLSFCHFL